MSSYGTPDELKAVVATANALGLISDDVV